jgi:hypothetical protein
MERGHFIDSKKEMRTGTPQLLPLRPPIGDILAMDRNGPSPKRRAESGTIHGVAVTLLTGGDRPCAFGLATELISKGVSLDLIGSDDLDCMAVGCGDALLEKRRTLRRRTIFPKGRPHQETRASSRFP